MEIGILWQPAKPLGTLPSSIPMIRSWTISALLLCFGAAACAQQVQTLPGTQPLTWEGDLSQRMMDGAHRFVERKIAESIQTRSKYWSQDFSSGPAYDKSGEPNREPSRQSN